MSKEKLVIHLTEKELGEVIKRELKDCLGTEKQPQEEKGSKEELICAADLIREYGISKTTMYNWIRNGNLPRPIKLGKLVYFLREDLANFVNQKRRDNEGV